jgi:hypothetical protein
MNFLSSCSCSLPFVAISFRVFRSVLYGSFGLRHWVVRERFVIECTNPAVTKGGLFFVSLVSSYFLSFDYLISWNTRISHSQLIHLLIMIHMILYGALYQIGEESSQRGYTIACQWPVSFPLYIKKKKTQTLVNEHKRAVTRFANRQLPRISFFFKHVINFAVDAMKWWRPCCRLRLFPVTLFCYSFGEELRFVFNFFKPSQSIIFYKLKFVWFGFHDGKRKDTKITDTRFSLPSSRCFFVCWFRFTMAVWIRSSGLACRIMTDGRAIDISAIRYQTD